MATKVKVKDLANELGVKSDEVLEQLRKLYVDVEDENSKVDDKIVGLVRIKLGISAKSKKPAKIKATSPNLAEASKEKKEKGKRKKEKEEKEKPEKPEKKKAAPKKKAGEKTEEPEKEKGEKKETESPEEKKPEDIELAVPDKTEKPFKKGKGPVSKPFIEVVKKAEVPKPEEEKPKKKKQDLEVVNKEDMPRPFRKKARKTFKRIPVIEVIEKGGRPGKKSRPGGKVVRPTSSMFKTGAPSTAERKGTQKIAVQIPVNIRALAPRINCKPNDIIQYLMGRGALVNINQDLEEDVVRDVMANFGYELEIPDTIESIEKDLVGDHHTEEQTRLEVRAPVVTFMGHVDHGKTSLLDYIRKTMVTKGEKGGITQHIGAYKVESAHGSVTFLDTPGHAAFTAMRARGAHATDVVVLVVAADDGVMPQTKEAIDHARAAKVPIVVAINKCDLPGANPENVRRELQQENLAAEDWGGDTIMVEVSAETGEGVDKLVEMLMLESEMLELKANPKLKARGVVIEGKKTPGQGVVATLLVQNGTLYPGDIVVVGSFYGKVKAMFDNKRQRVDRALPSTPVEVLGLQGVPRAGEEFFVVKDEKKAKTLSTLKQDAGRKSSMPGSQRITLEDFHSLIIDGSMKELKIILKADVQGSVEALSQSLLDLSTSEVKLDVIHAAVGNINESDVMLSMVANAVILGFHVKAETKAEEIAKSEKVDVRVYDVIYEAIADVQAAMEGLLEPELKEVIQGRAQVLQIFSSNKGKAAGCSVTKGVIRRKDRIRIKRAQENVHEGEILALKRFKDDAREVREGFECGITIKGFNNINENDIIESYIIEKIARRLGKK